MDSFTINLISNASGELFPNNKLSSFTNFLPEQVNLEGQWEVAISEIPYPLMYQNMTEGKVTFFDEKLPKSTSNYNLEPGLYTSITDIVEAMNTIIQERNNYNETCITVKVSRRTQKVVIMLATIPLVLHSVAATWVTFLVTMWETNLGYWWQENVLMNPNLLTTLFVSIRWWFTAI